MNNTFYASPSKNTRGERTTEEMLGPLPMTRGRSSHASPMTNEIPPQARGTAVDCFTSVEDEACRIPFPSDGLCPLEVPSVTETEDQKSYSEGQSSPVEFTHTKATGKLAPETEMNSANTVSPLTRELQTNSENNTTSSPSSGSGNLKIGPSQTGRKSSGSIERIFNHMKTTEITDTTNGLNLTNDSNTEAIVTKNTPTTTTIGEVVVRRADDGFCVNSEHKHSVPELISHQPRQDLRNLPVQTNKEEAQQLSGNDKENYANVCEITNEISNERLGINTAQENKEDSERVESTTQGPSWASLANNKKHQSPPWFSVMEKDRKRDIRVTVIKYINGELGRSLQEELLLKFGLDAAKTCQLEDYVRKMEGRSSSSDDAKDQKEEEASDWVSLGGARSRRGRSRRRTTPSGMSYTCSETASSIGSRNTSRARLESATPSVDERPHLPVPIGAENLSGLKAIKAEQLRLANATNDIDRILQEDLSAENVAGVAEKLTRIVCEAGTKLTQDVARRIVQSKAKPVAEKKKTKGAAKAAIKTRSEQRGSLLASLVVGLTNCIAEFSRSDEPADLFREKIIDECFGELSRRGNRPPMQSIAALVGELHVLDYVDDDFIHDCTSVLLRPKKKSHVDVCVLMLDRCTFNWKLKQRLVFPHGHYDELKRQSRNMGKTAYMNVKRLAERTRPSWMDRQEDARERREQESMRRRGFRYPREGTAQDMKDRPWQSHGKDPTNFQTYVREQANVLIQPNTKALKRRERRVRRRGNKKNEEPLGYSEERRQQEEVKRGRSVWSNPSDNHRRAEASSPALSTTSVQSSVPVGVPLYNTPRQSTREVGSIVEDQQAFNASRQAMQMMTQQMLLAQQNAQRGQAMANPTGGFLIQNSAPFAQPASPTTGGYIVNPSIVNPSIVNPNAQMMYMPAMHPFFGQHEMVPMYTPVQHYPVPVQSPQVQSGGIHDRRQAQGHQAWTETSSDQASTIATSTIAPESSLRLDSPAPSSQIAAVEYMTIEPEEAPEDALQQHKERSSRKKKRSQKKKSSKKAASATKKNRMKKRKRGKRGGRKQQLATAN